MKYVKFDSCQPETVKYDSCYTKTVKFDSCQSQSGIFSTTRLQNHLETTNFDLWMDATNAILGHKRVFTFFHFVSFTLSTLIYYSTVTVWRVKKIIRNRLNFYYIFLSTGKTRWFVDLFVYFWKKSILTDGSTLISSITLPMLSTTLFRFRLLIFLLFSFSLKVNVHTNAI